MTAARSHRIPTIAIAIALHDDELLAASVAALREAEGGVSGTSGFPAGHPIQSAQKNRESDLILASGSRSDDRARHNPWKTPRNRHRNRLRTRKKGSPHD